MIALSLLALNPHDIMTIKPSEIFELFAKAELSNDPCYNLELPLNEKKESILEQAHPDSVVLFNAHDKLNGLIENLLEQNKITTWIATKTPRGASTQEIYLSAYKGFYQELIKTSSKLEMYNEILAQESDLCLNYLIKESALPFLIPILIGLGVTTAYTILSQNLVLHQGVVQDISSALVEISEAVDDYPALAQELAGLIEMLKEVEALGKQAANVQISALPSVGKTTEKAEQALSTVQSQKDLASIQLLQKYQEKTLQLNKILPNYISLLKLKEQQLEESTSDIWSPLKKLYRTLIPSDVQDVVLKLEALSTSIEEVPDMIRTQIKLFQEMRNRVESAKPNEIKEPEIINVPKEMRPNVA